MGFLSGISSFVKEHSEVIHGVLDVAGFIPGVGAVADLANAGLYAAEGDYLNAGLSLVSAIPGIGDTVALAKKSANAIKGGLKSLKGLKNINALNKAKDIKKVLTGMRGRAKTGASRLNRGMKNTDEAFDVVKNEIKEICTNGRCFTGDTLVYTVYGYKPIKEIHKGDEVYSRNEETGEIGLKEVEEVFRTTAHTIYHVWVDGKEEFKTTAYHPVYVQEQGWVTAINLHKGDIIETMGGSATITKVEKTRHEEPIPVYNFHVKDWVSYFVSKINIYVHNACKNTIITPQMKSKILEGERVQGTNRVIGGHSPKINNTNPDFATEIISINTDGTSKIKFIKQFSDGNISKIKNSTIFPNTWSDNKIIKSIKKVGDGNPIGHRARDGTNIYRDTVDGVQIEVIKIGKDVISGYPTGGGITGLPSGFVI